MRTLAALVLLFTATPAKAEPQGSTGSALRRRHLRLRFAGHRAPGAAALSHMLGGTHAAAAGGGGAFVAYTAAPLAAALPGLLSVEALPDAAPVHPDAGAAACTNGVVAVASEAPPIATWALHLRRRGVDAELLLLPPSRHSGSNSSVKVFARVRSGGEPAGRRLVAALAAQPEVRWVQPAATPRSFRSLNSVASSAVQTDSSDGSHPLWDAGLTGEGEIALVGDTGLDYDMCFFRDDREDVAFWPRTNPRHRKVLTYIECLSHPSLRTDHTDAVSGHGTHVSASLAGSALPGSRAGGTEASRFNGLAPAARLVFFDLRCSAAEEDMIQDLWDIRDYYGPGWEAGARVCHNSWGGPQPSAYESVDLETDDFAFRHQDFLIVYAAGNIPSDGVLSPAASKNAVTVGASRNSAVLTERDKLALSTAYGPSYDERRKPELLAPGESVRSADSDGKLGSNQCSVVAKSGTSMAAPWVSGAAVLLRQYLREGRYPGGRPNASAGFTPSSSLLKAMLIHSARPVAGLPHSHQGWGRLALQDVVHTAGSQTAPAAHLLLINNVSLTHRGTFDVCFTYVPGAAPITGPRATLVWMDPPAAEGSALSTVNDLDLAVVAPDGAISHANGKLGWDRTNTVERVDVMGGGMAQQAGQWRAAVHGASVVDHGHYRDGLPFALVVSAPAVRRADCAAASSCPRGCSGHGSCGPAGRCECAEGWAHIDCGECDADALCGGHGVCTASGHCTCSDGWAQPRCSACVPGRFGPDCSGDCNCGPHGRCGADGICECDAHWAGPHCAECAEGWGGPRCADAAHWCEHERVVRVEGEERGMIVVAGGGGYRNSLWCRWEILAPSPSRSVVMHFSALDAEQKPCCEGSRCLDSEGCDWLSVRDGGEAGTLLFRSSGRRPAFTVTALSGRAFVQFTTDFYQDNDHTYKGFEMCFDATHWSKVYVLKLVLGGILAVLLVILAVLCVRRWQRRQVPPGADYDAVHSEDGPHLHGAEAEAGEAEPSNGPAVAVELQAVGGGGRESAADEAPPEVLTQLPPAVERELTSEAPAQQ